ncbi:MAG: fibrobacter succinogenes major paralogous domain-containing protein [Bacteroidales bacterium]|nr:fibrobacter succinogenes major paralogous domain-containing protein [Bacteroidales bacterium]
MKRIVITSISIMLGFFTLAQDPILTTHEDSDKSAYTAELNKHNETSEDNMSSALNIGVLDRDGNSYKVVKIGDQIWMAENLRTTKFKDGTEIPLASDYKEWSNRLSPGYCWYFNKENYKNEYGALYNWYTVNTDKLCPSGWHVPSTEEWMKMISYLDEDKAGGELKEKGTKFWMSPNTGATNAIGFTALPGGSRGTLGSFFDEGLRGYWWSSTESDQNRAWYSALGYSSEKVTGSSDNKKGGLSVRCVKD